MYSKLTKEGQIIQTASKVNIYPADYANSKSILLARGKAQVRNFSAKPLQLDDNLQTYVEVDSVRVMLAGAEELKIHLSIDHRNKKC